MASARDFDPVRIARKQGCYVVEVLLQGHRIPFLLVDLVPLIVIVKG